MDVSERTGTRFEAVTGTHESKLSHAHLFAEALGGAASDLIGTPVETYMRKAAS